jgi:hypothetical protein
MTPGQQDTGLGQIGEAIKRDGVYLAFEPQPALLETCWYTIGLTDHRHPELILFGLPPDISRSVLHAVAEKVIEGRRTCVAGQYADDVLERHPVTFVAVTEPDRHLPVATQFYAGMSTAVEALQIVWPDRYHRWPWQAGTHVNDMPVLGQRLSL